MTTTLLRTPEPVPKPEIPESETGELRRYVYCVIDCDQPKSFDCDAIDNRSGVYTVVHNGIAAVVSPTVEEKFSIDRENTLAHQRVMEHVMGERHTVLPVKFDTLAEGKDGLGPEERIIERVLAKRSDELSSLLGLMSTRVEMGLKVLWRDMNTVFREIVDSSDEIKRLRRKVAGVPGGGQFSTRVRLGELAKNALEAKKEREQKAILDAVRDTLADSRQNKTFGDQMFANLALLVEEARIGELDRRVEELAEAAPERINLKYIGPVPPSNFIELVITWDE